MKDLTRRQLRYWCFRFRTEATEGVPADGAPDGLADEVEANDYFGGWENFGMTWDWDADGERIVPLRYTLEEEWNAQAWANAREVPTVEERVKALEN